eukprot:6475514-Amphidinium_carterae.2
MRSTQKTSQSTSVLSSLAARLKVSMPEVTKYVQATAELCWVAQCEMFDAMVQYIWRQKQAQLLEPLAFVERTAYDETPLRVRTAIGPDSEGTVMVSKIFVQHVSWRMVVRAATLQSPTREMMMLCGQWSATVRVAERTTAECTASVVDAGPQLVSSRVAELFPQVHRVCETDDAGGNVKGERYQRDKLLALTEHIPTCQALHVHHPCTAHKLHAVANKVWNIDSDTVSGILHVLLVVQAAQNWAKLQKAIDTLPESLVEVVPTEGSMLSTEAEEYRRAALEAFAPPTKYVRKRGVIVLACCVLNGDWRSKTKLQHRCPGPECCPTKAHSVVKVRLALRRIAKVLRPSRLNKGNWQQVTKTTSSAKLPRIVWLEPIVCQPLLSTTAERKSARTLESDTNAQFLDEAVSKYRQEEEEHRRVALSFLSNEAAHRIYTLRAVLACEIDLMQSMLADNSSMWEARQLMTQATDRRHFRAVDNYVASCPGGTFHKALADASDRLCTPYLWAHLPQTETFVNHTYKLMARQAAGIYKLLISRCRTYPSKLLAVLDNPDIGADIVHDYENYPCLLDSWSREFLSLHPSLESLLAPATLCTLSAVAAELMTNTFNVERAHTKNATRSRHRVTHPMQVSDIASWNMAEACPHWLQSYRERDTPPRPTP